MLLFGFQFCFLLVWGFCLVYSYPAEFSSRHLHTDHVHAGCLIFRDAENILAFLALIELRGVWVFENKMFFHVQ